MCGPGGALQRPGGRLGLGEGGRRDRLLVHLKGDVLATKSALKAVRKCGSGVEPVGLVAFEGPHHGRAHGLGNVGVVGAGRQRLLVLLPDCQLGQRGSLVGQAAGQELVEHDSERVHVGRGGGLFAPDLLGSEVGGGADHRADLGDAGLLGRPGDAEVGQLAGHLAAADRAADDHQVAGLHVTVDDPVPVGVLESGAGLDADLHGHFRVDQAFGLENLCPRLALHALHHDEVAAVVDAGVIDLDDVRVDQLGHSEGFAAEAGDEAVVVGKVFGQHLDRHGAFEDAVGRPVDVRHASGTQLVAELVAVGEDRGFSHRRSPGAQTAGTRTGIRSGSGRVGRCGWSRRLGRSRIRGRRGRAGLATVPFVLIF